MCVCVRACVGARVCVCERAYVCVCVRAQFTASPSLSPLQLGVLFFLNRKRKGYGPSV